MEDKQEKPAGSAAFEGWTQAEKYYLIKALETIDRRNINKIREYLPNKTYEEIKAAIDYSLQEAYEHPKYKELMLKLDKKYKAKKMSKSGDPLASWAKKLTDSYTADQLRTETAAALRVIADCENLPAPAATENVDFREVYRQLANAVEGKPVTADIPTTAILKKCLHETTLASKAFHKHSTSRHLLKTLNDMTDTETDSTFYKPTEDQDVAILRSLTAQKNYNPLNVPEAYLKPCGEEKRASK